MAQIAIVSLEIRFIFFKLGSFYTCLDKTLSMQSQNEQQACNFVHIQLNRIATEVFEPLHIDVDRTACTIQKRQAHVKINEMHSCITLTFESIELFSLLIQLIAIQNVALERKWCSAANSSRLCIVL